MGEKNNQRWGWGLDKEISGSFPDYLSLMLAKKPRIRLNDLKTSLRLPCLGLNPTIDSIFSPIGQEYPFLQVSEIFLPRPALSA